MVDQTDKRAQQQFMEKLYDVKRKRGPPREPRRHYIDMGIGHSFSSSGNFDSLIAAQQITVGPADYNRIGSVLQLQRLTLDFHFAKNGLYENDSKGRIIVFYDKQPNMADAAPHQPPPIYTITASNLLLTQFSNGGTTTNNNSPINLNNEDRFLILKDFSITFPSTYPIDDQAYTTHVPTKYTAANGFADIPNPPQTPDGTTNAGIAYPGFQVYSDVTGASPGNTVTNPMLSTQGFPLFNSWTNVGPAAPIAAPPVIVDVETLHPINLVGYGNAPIDFKADIHWQFDLRGLTSVLFHENAIGAYPAGEGVTTGEIGILYLGSSNPGWTPSGQARLEWTE